MPMENSPLQPARDTPDMPPGHMDHAPYYDHEATEFSASCWIVFTLGLAAIALIAALM